MKCGRCHGTLVPIERERTIEFRGRSATVLARYLQCDGCGELLVYPNDSTDASQRAADIIRREEGLLTSADIRAVREHFGLTQREFERLLRVGKNTVVRWEAGTVIQNPAIDDKIRALQDVPKAAEYFAERNGVQLPNLRQSSIHSSLPVNHTTTVINNVVIVGESAGITIEGVVNLGADPTSGALRRFSMNPLGGPLTGFANA